MQNLLRKYILVQRCGSHFVFFYSWAGGIRPCFPCPDNQIAHPRLNYFLPQPCTFLYSGLCNSVPCSSEGSLQNSSHARVFPPSRTCSVSSRLCCRLHCPASLLPLRCSREGVCACPRPCPLTRDPTLNIPLTARRYLEARLLPPPSFR